MKSEQIEEREEALRGAKVIGVQEVEWLDNEYSAVEVETTTGETVFLLAVHWRHRWKKDRNGELTGEGSVTPQPASLHLVTENVRVLTDNERASSEP
ncbi:hypothetical protein [Botrimarina mediterranea]|uniref:Uncharacterized protein n=1 Tax=Botrimarina mediterranea TaxID=2528022 RepID=A0A518K601_9BACT|nr:hypothetical protein [Botrimarina mediterranea]QDV73222.1 hypothetical protein Spa11_14180 [Botrimarina mediterranea]